MTRRVRFSLLAASVACMFAPSGAAQTSTPLPFSIRIQQGTTVQNIADGGTLALPADGIGLPSDGSISISYKGTGTATANITAMDVTGSTEFSVTGLPELPLTVTPAAPNFSVNVRYLPGSSKLASGRINFTYTEANRAGTFSVLLSGTAPEFAFTYIPLPNGNSTLLPAGGAIVFPPTAIDETSAATIVIANKGSGAGVVNSITSTGAEFALAGLPFPPATIDAGKDLRFSVRFTPEELDPVSGAVRVDFVAGRTSTFKLQGSGTGAVFEYDLIQQSGVASLLPGQVIMLPDALVGEKSAITVRVRNAGNADGRIQAITASGTGFSLAEVPFTPATLAAGNSVTFTINFSPTQPGRTAGKLRIGADSFDLAGNGLGPTLTYSYSAGGMAFQLQSGSTIVFPPVAVGQSATVRFVVSNNGTADSAINSISASGPANTFTLSELPGLPASVVQGGTVQFTVTFTPSTVGSIAGSLKIDTQTFPLSGVGNPPAPLPDYSFQGASGVLEPSQQPATGLSLSSAYPLALTGSLTLAFNSEVFTNDPAVQFATGGRTVAFTIPAGAKDAIFANGSNQIRIQSGTVAGTIVLTPAFATTGGIDMTPQDPAALNLTVPQSAPTLLSVVVSSKTASSLTLLVTGYATGRSVTQMDFQFTPVAGESVSTTKVTLNLESTFQAWYQGTASQQYGSLFTATVPFNMQGDITNVTNVSDTVQSVSVTLTNRQGVSAAKSVDIH